MRVLHGDLRGVDASDGFAPSANAQCQFSLRTHATCRIASRLSAQHLLRLEDHKREIRWATSLRIFSRWIVLNQAAPIVTTSARRLVRWTARRKSSPNRKRESVISTAYEREVPGRAQRHRAVNGRRMLEGPSAQVNVARNKYLGADVRYTRRTFILSSAAFRARDQSIAL
jgi:hypothetical protein